MAKSILQSDKECYLCRKRYNLRTTRGLEEHHILFGRGRRELSERYGLKVWLCHNHHNEPPLGVHFDPAAGGSWNRRHNLLLTISMAPAALPRCSEKKFSF